MEDIIGSSEPTVENVQDYLDNLEHPENFESARTQNDTLRTMLRDTHDAYTRAMSESLKWQVIAGFLGCLSLAAMVGIVLEGFVK